jgi:two-component system chemotaxis sensor kinase CheA
MSYGLVVGSFHDTEEVVVKPLGNRLKHLSEYSGATILGDGTVALILDMAGLANRADITSMSGEKLKGELSSEDEQKQAKEVHSLLFFLNSPEEPCAIPLDLVQRIEHITGKDIETLGGHRAMQYRGGLLPLVTMGDSANVNIYDSSKNPVVLVTNVNGHEVGLLGNMPIDVVEANEAIDQKTHRQTGVAGSTIINGRTTLIVDIFELVDTVFPDWGEEKVKERAEERKQEDKSIKILLAEDSDFFRAQVK